MPYLCLDHISLQSTLPQLVTRSTNIHFLYSGPQPLFLWFLTYEVFVNLFKLKSSFTLYYGLLSAIKNKWKILSAGRQRQTRKHNWYDDEENLSDAALPKIIVENKFQPPANEKRTISYGVEPSEIQNLYKWPLLTKNTK